MAILPPDSDWLTTLAPTGSTMSPESGSPAGTGMSPAGKAAGGRSHGENEPRLGGAQPPSNVTNLHGERPLNVIFNYNGESWDAYEVLGLPAGSSLERAEQVYAESLQRVDEGARPFMEAAFAAIKTQWDSYKIPKGS